MQYYIIHNNQQFGPMEISELVNYELSPESMVWTTGMAQWVKAGTVEEIRLFMENRISGSTNQAAEEAKYFIIKDNQQIGPFSISELRQQGITADTLIWEKGLANWTPAKDIDCLKSILGAIPPAIPQPPTYAPGSQPQHLDNALLMKINDMKTWIVIVIIAGFLFSCIGGIFAIIALTKINSARDSLNTGSEYIAETNYQSAKNWLIAAIVCTGLGLIVNISQFATLF